LNQPADQNMPSSRLLLPWDGPYGGVPPWHEVDPAEFQSAMERAMEMELDEINAITSTNDAPTFENTIVALEKSGQALSRLTAMYHVHTSNLNLGPMPDIESAIEPKLARHADMITQNPLLFDRVNQIHQSPDVGWSVAQQRLVDKIYKRFVRQGASLNESDKQKLSAINVKLSGLFTQFSQNVLAAEERKIRIEDGALLSGLPQNVVDALAAPVNEQANERRRGSDASDGEPQMWIITNTRSSIEPVLTYADDRGLRQQVWETYYNRCDNSDPNDNNRIISAILKLRAQRAALLGYATHAHWTLENQMAKTPSDAMRLMESIWPKAVARAREEVAAMQAVADGENAGLTIQPWDYRYYAEKVRKAKYDLDFNQVKPYLQLEKLREGMMWAAGEVFGLTFNEVEDVPVFHTDMRVWSVDRNGRFMGLWYFDPFARAGKRSGAWMTDYRPQSHLDQSVRPLVSNNSNFINSGSERPILISWDDAETLFHEFGHALHGLCSDCKYPSQSGTSVALDFVEFPSQIYESWLATPEMLTRYAVHYQTGEPIPEALVKKIESAKNFNQGFATVEYLACALVDMKLHLADDLSIDPVEFEQATLDALGMPKEIVMRHRTPHFSHIFSGDSYSAGYYSYIWAEALTADAAEAFEAAGSYFDSETSQRLLETIFAIGDTRDAAEAFESFRGRGLDPESLFRKRGFVD
jgi:peptidyl-dipeptidase Dcp